MSRENKPKLQAKIILGVIFLAIYSLGWYLGRNGYEILPTTPKAIVIGKETTKNVDFKIFWRSWELLEKQYDGKIDYEKMVYGAIKGMTEALGDPYTAFLTPEESKELEGDLSGKISGIGAEIGIKNNKLTVISPIDDSPAKKSGIKAGDIILAVNDELTQGMDVSEAVSKIRGEAGTKVKLQIKRVDSVKEYNIERAEFTVKSVKAEVKEKNIGYISISRFDENTSTTLREKLTEFKSKNIKKIVIDLRDNPGGYLDQSIYVASEFIKSGVIVSEKNEVAGKAKEDYKATQRGLYTNSDVRIVVLVNKGSASAAEIVAGALKDYKRAILVGETTFGKGSVQKLEKLANGSELRITVAHWYTPSGKNISKEGIKPDYEVTLTDEDYNKDRDPQLDKALSLLKS